MTAFPVPEDQRLAFETICQEKGLDPSGFALQAYGASESAISEIGIRTGEIEYKYPVTPGDHNWPRRYFTDLNADTADVKDATN
ncbi:hypothetical protein OVY01_09600 [Robbsia sp. Bb-Pol-6]|uniref:Uncharacterized protein n=2 Tax=Robbsia betulipollinis TaxID=2981849 RepID=A0ABT3ZLT3_9BURK|nr:hypothetical protein [Robbsia betulipollinis]